MVTPVQTDTQTSKGAITSPNTNKQQIIIDNLIKLAKQEQDRGNTSVTQDKLAKLQEYLKSKDAETYPKFNKLPKVPKPKYSLLFNKFDLNKAVSNPNKPHPQTQRPARRRQYSPYRKFSLKRLESIVIEVLETLANILDNLHLFSRLPMFPQYLLKLLKQTNKLWVLILVFLIRKTVSQLLNVIRKERKVNVELNLLNSAKSNAGVVNEDINKKYNKVLKDLKFDKMMLILELIGNFLDMSFNVIELYGIPVPDWFMSVLNAASMGMTIYRMNKDDEYVDDDITEDLI
ncbi:uncharacterized protein CANTADRAFT_25830 [Suhomyces tanzawaensis NRRL Y-17324]|uniref:Uncharacterized protein n=1 Tax=Suhomyces tanzawaensis NRRL Y-17324 TaxID=984487 RepID=A0A1E4SKS8_9ASCO|nr:uncharacterized protein CANTADRAFT_25830 [Suhomyces tanzawaensis NRRL Y-17324]ODV80111.1 hypothetical protein CANTADRAFT_25830 [Suhomyces tanzawaensis NRRL Y-17324]